MDSTKHRFLVAYDYGMGGLWGVILARSADEIRAVYPELAVVDAQPAWMEDEELRGLEEAPYDIDGAPWGILNAVLADRGK